MNPRGGKLDCKWDSVHCATNILHRAEGGFVEVQRLTGARSSVEKELCGLASFGEIAFRICTALLRGWGNNLQAQRTELYDLFSVDSQR